MLWNVRQSTSIITLKLNDNVNHLGRTQHKPWWRHQMETFSAQLAICAGNSPVPGEFPTQRPVTRRFDVFFDLHLNKWLSKQSWGWWFETLSWSLWRHCNGHNEWFLIIQNNQFYIHVHNEFVWHDIEYVFTNFVPNLIFCCLFQGQLVLQWCCYVCRPLTPTEHMTQ